MSPSHFSQLFIAPQRKIEKATTDHLIQALKKVVINEVEIPTPNEDQIIVRVLGATVCSSDTHPYTALAGKMNRIDEGITQPTTVGHEAVGKVVAMHQSTIDAQKDFTLGDVIGFHYVANACHKCPGCMVNPLQCAVSEPKVRGYHLDGFMAEYAVVDVRCAMRIPRNVEEKRNMAALFCGGLTGKK